MKTYISIFIAGLIAGAFLIYQFHKPESITKTNTVTQVRVKTVTRTVKEPNGRVVIEQETTDNSKLSTSQTVAKQNKPKYILGLTAGSALDDIKPVYGLQAQFRAFGPVFAGAYGRTDGELGLVISLEF